MNHSAKHYRKIAHMYFDPIWMYKSYRLRKKASLVRKKTYKWLAKKMGIPIEECHFSNFTKDQCIHAIEICKQAWSDKIIEYIESPKFIYEL